MAPFARLSRLMIPIFLLIEIINAVEYLEVEEESSKWEDLLGDILKYRDMKSSDEYLLFLKESMASCNWYRWYVFVDYLGAYNRFASGIQKLSHDGLSQMSDIEQHKLMSSLFRDADTVYVGFDYWYEEDRGYPEYQKIKSYIDGLVRTINRLRRHLKIILM